MSEHADTPFVRYKSRHVITWTLINLCRLHDFPGILDGTRPLEGRTVLCVGAGPSLEKNGEHVAIAREKGIPIFAVNASDSVLRSYGIDPDVVVMRESLELDDQVRASRARCLVLDVGVSPTTWDAARDHETAEARWFVPTYPRHIQACRRLGVRPMYGGTSAMTSAVSLAFTWGAAKVIACGIDLAGSPDGRVYHPKAPRGQARAVASTSEGLYKWTGDDQDKERSERSGQRPQPSEVGFEWIPSDDWSELLPCLPTWQNQREWLSTEAKRRLGKVECINATEGGGGTMWWRCAPLRETLEAEPEASPLVLPKGAVVSAEHSRMLRDDMIKDANKLRQLCREMVDPDGPDLRLLAHIPGLVEGTRLVEALGEWKLLDAPKESGAKRCRYIYETWAETADEALRAMGAA